MYDNFRHKTEKVLPTAAPFLSLNLSLIFSLSYYLAGITKIKELQTSHIFTKLGMKDFYNILGISPTATKDEISKSFKKLAVKYHPDKTSDPKHHELFIAINEAYETLKEEDTRKKYDRDMGINRLNNINPNIFTPSTGGFPASNPGNINNFFTRHFELKFRGNDIFEERRDTWERLRKEAEMKAKREKELREQELERMKQEERRKAEEAAKAAKAAKEDAEKFKKAAEEELDRLRNQKQESDDIYNQRKRQAYTARWNQPFKAFSDDVFQSKSRESPDRQKGNEQSDPIIIESEIEIDVEEPEVEAEDESIEKESENTTETNQPKTSSSNLDDEIEILDDVEVKKEKETKKREGEDVLRELFKRRKKDPQKSFLFDDLKDSLKPNIEDVDFDDLLNNLQQQKGTKTNPQKKQKKQKVSEFSDGTSKAETLFTPINKKQFKNHTGLTMMDFNADSKVMEISPPEPPVIILSGNMTKPVWDGYEQSIKDYQLAFLDYKRKIVTYQMERASRDKELFNIVNEDYANFEVYERCLEQDVKVLKKYTESMVVFHDTMKLYRYNYNWKRMANIMD